MLFYQDPILFNVKGQSRFDWQLPEGLCSGLVFVGLNPAHVRYLSIRANGLLLFEFSPGVGMDMEPITGGQVLHYMNRLMEIDCFGEQQSGAGLCLWFDAHSGVFRTINVGRGNMVHVALRIDFEPGSGVEVIDCRVMRSVCTVPDGSRGYGR